MREKGYDSERRTFTQYYGSKELDASVLNIPLVGFLPGTDERVTGTIDAVARELGRNFPQAFSHLTLILAARAITTAECA